jgi:hypothetical protein
MIEICKTFFKMDNEIINGYKILNENGMYNIYVYTTCEKLGNWQEFLSYDSVNKVINYFKKIVMRDITDNQPQTIWNIKENEWRKNTLDLLLQFR